MPRRCLLYYITDRKAFPGGESAQRHALLKKIKECACAGVDYIQLREKDLSTRQLESLAREAVAILRETKKTESSNHQTTALLINSRTDVARAVETDGVHLRGEDISPSDVQQAWKLSSCGAGTLARENSPRKPVIAVSCHTPAEVSQAEKHEADFAVFGPVFEKKDAADVKPAGLASLGEACRGKIPVLALGGITLENAPSCLQAGAAGIAAIRLFQENDIAQIVRTLRLI